MKEAAPLGALQFISDNCKEPTDIALVFDGRCAKARLALENWACSRAVPDPVGITVMFKKEPGHTAPDKSMVFGANNVEQGIAQWSGQRSKLTTSDQNRSPIYLDVEPLGHEVTLLLKEDKARSLLYLSSWHTSRVHPGVRQKLFVRREGLSLVRFTRSGPTNNLRRPWRSRGGDRVRPEAFASRSCPGLLF